MVDRIKDVLTITDEALQPVPATGGIASTGHAEGIFISDKDMICFVKLDASFANGQSGEWEKAA